MMKEPLVPMIGIVTDVRVDTPDVKTFRVNAPGGDASQAVAATRMSAAETLIASSERANYVLGLSTPSSATGRTGAIVEMACL